ncbi:unnamed protein product [Musa acuminata subsp. malaccensis]|uniref:(wild Malaysian banana) hypothetical protein n=1 Tax=Musa acuminata subsp. malaccensis TaxID=214687 RepID=A0A804JKK8_MUSAM|nr:PREDICTED: transcription factor bHLH49-like [Musa acuminata subsp. malaccensis]XP_009387112.1 PREDICTED: transcription factor bHLH49-like [Musa acuminata subsp. malaccensis]XP_018677249.1 PREDICTED: transcription factor bHLH49-like [Musa acuminata subsp. malaccensis]XP_018677250.1 PREDICTED: transcription factor bHLH49-like [Musa acuminata subsp. malaccensis]XP_018677251.1 PREDICTED: transcription factor bHLH49-like [Musa acuminata subsp. malaccensis]CAG1847446.1 unnamed protein product [Mu
MYSAKQSEDVVGRSTKSALMAHSAAARVAEESSRNTWDPIDYSYNISLPQDQETNGLVAGGMSASCLSERYQLGSAPFPPHKAVISKHSIETNIKGNKRKGQAECGALPSQSPEDRAQNVKAEEQYDVSLKSSSKHPTANDEKKRKNEVRLGSNNQSPASKDDYIHVRAKRGQATNSHSLAERIRREKISERMKLLQDLVPGCSKINGKAMMLDEIINYVQSLQRQVEFLSMKLAAVNPELNFDLEQILSGDIHSCYGGSAVPAIGPGMSSFQPQLYGSTFQRITQPEMFYSAPSSGDLLQASLSQISNMSQLPIAWHNDLQNTLPMNSIPNETPTERNGINPF